MTMMLGCYLCAGFAGMGCSIRICHLVAAVAAAEGSLAPMDLTALPAGRAGSSVLKKSALRSQVLGVTKQAAHPSRDHALVLPATAVCSA